MGITIVGIIIVFLVLAILSGFFILFKYFSKGNNREVKREINIPHTNPKPVTAPAAIKSEEFDEDEEVVAAIMGAITAMLGHNRFKINNIKVNKNNLKSRTVSMWGKLPAATVWRVKKIGR
ncbi:Oxaloacetate decarboxylase, gamma chain [Marinitoga piezophila KA3]|uniref:Oxaloacetate decarboxylase, gamma chain n=1 Tax=Marinitoga piezophila (strain DSM 14283 / JCM 11233 / KA3) TaxID=443254 RepID=H2J694_MARPK|nr:Oxaloacetate decarboxylase, gamma chain [Marinitoga piezophila KA3]